MYACFLKSMCMCVGGRNTHVYDHVCIHFQKNNALIYDACIKEQRIPPCIPLVCMRMRAYVFDVCVCVRMCSMYVPRVSSLCICVHVRM